MNKEPSQAHCIKPEASRSVISNVSIYIIRIYHECEGRIEKSVPRIAFWHHEACRVMTNGDLGGRVFLSYPHTNNEGFFLVTTVFIYLLFTYFKVSFQKSLNMLRCSFI